MVETENVRLWRKSGTPCSVMFASDEWDTACLNFVPQFFCSGHTTMEFHAGQDVIQLNIYPAQQAWTFSAKTKQKKGECNESNN